MQEGCTATRKKYIPMSRMLFVLTLPPQALTRAGFKGISQLHKQSLIGTPGELNSKNMITLFIELSKVKYSHSALSVIDR